MDHTGVRVAAAAVVGAVVAGSAVYWCVILGSIELLHSFQG